MYQNILFFIIAILIWSIGCREIFLVFSNYVVTIFLFRKFEFLWILTLPTDRPILWYLVYKESISHVLSDAKIKVMDHLRWLILEAKNRYFHVFRDFRDQKSSRYRPKSIMIYIPFDSVKKTLPDGMSISLLPIDWFLTNQKAGKLPVFWQNRFHFWNLRGRFGVMYFFDFCHWVWVHRSPWPRTL